MDIGNFFWILFAQLRRQTCELLRAPMTPEAAVALAEKLTSGRLLDLLELFPQPVRMSSSVEFGPQPNPGRN